MFDNSFHSRFKFCGQRKTNLFLHTVHLKHLVFMTEFIKAEILSLCLTKQPPPAYTRDATVKNQVWGKTIGELDYDWGDKGLKSKPCSSHEIH